MLSPKAVLARHGLRPKKSFGQNFLGDEGLLERLAELTDEGCRVIEIGAGIGNLTQVLLARGHRVTAIERDRELVPVLRQELLDWERTGHLRIVEADAKQVDYASLFSEAGVPPYVLVGNLPYQLTGPLLRRVTEHGAQLECCVLLVQLEVAERLAAVPGGRDWGALSVFVQVVFDCKREFIVRRGAFYPQPNVDSAAVRLVPREPPRGAQSPWFQPVVKAAFQQRRKRLKNALLGLREEHRLTAETLQRAADEAGVDLEVRGETLSVDDLARLADALSRASCPPGEQG